MRALLITVVVAWVAPAVGGQKPSTSTSTSTTKPAPAPTPPPATPPAATPPPATPAPTEAAPAAPKLMYTTYFYTAGEAVIHGYEPGTRARVAALGSGAGTLWEGTVEPGQTVLVKTGRGVFAFLSDKKAGILAGTPSSCAIVGYFASDESGSFRSNRFFSQLPSSFDPKGRVVVWAYEDAEVTIRDRTSQVKLWSGKLAAGKYQEVVHPGLSTLGGHTLEVTADKRAVAVQIYNDEGFAVPGKEGWMTGKEFYTYIGEITNGMNDLELFAYEKPAAVTITDVNTRQVVWKGTVPAGGVQALTLTSKYLHIASDRGISASVAPYIHYTGPYQEHHYAAGQQGSGIDRLFYVTTPLELWIFSYFADNQVTVTDPKSGAVVWQGPLAAGGVASLSSGQGYFKIASDKGISVMAGAGSCGAAFSPAGGMFNVDEQLFAVIKQIKEERIKRAEAEGRVLTEAEKAAPLSAAEKQAASDAVRRATKGQGIATGSAARGSPSSAPAAAPAPAAPAASMSDAELDERLEAIEGQ